jgi:AcrR family transcriptional regulator
VTPEERRRARHHQTDGEHQAPRRAPFTVERVVDAALGVVAEEGYDSLTMRRVAAALGTGPASLYAHVVNKADLDELLIGRLTSELELPDPDPAVWRDQIRSVLRQLRDQYLRYPGISRAALALAPTNLDTLRVNEAMLAILLAGGAEPQTAAWASDALSLYVGAYCQELAVVQRRAKDPATEWVVSRDEMVRRLTSLPRDRFPATTEHAKELTAGTGHERFDFAVDLMLDGVARTSGVRRG